MPSMTCVYVHGAGNKVAEEPLRRQWDRALFGSAQSSSRMAYWADLRYPAPLRAVVAESAAVYALLSEDGWFRRQRAALGRRERVSVVIAELGGSRDGEETGTTRDLAG